MHTIAHKKYLFLLIGIFVICGAGARFILYQSKSLERDIRTAISLYNAFRPDYNSHLADRSDFILWEKAAFPASGHFSSSTEFFINLMKEKWIVGCNYGLFALSGVPPYWGEDPHMFSNTNNAWCVVLDYDSKRIPDAPFMFSRNLDIRHLSEADPSRLRDIEPYGLRGVLVVSADGVAGEAKFIRAEDLEKEFNPQGLTNAVLRP